MAEPSHRTAIIVAIIGLIATLGAALIGNWHRIFAPSTPPYEKVVSPRTPEAKRRLPPETVPTINGVWRDVAYPSNSSRITQDGNDFRFTREGVLPNGVRFESSGSGTITGQGFASSYDATYGSGTSSVGDCSGTVSPDGARMEMDCRDSALGNFPVTAIRQ